MREETSGSIIGKLVHELNLFLYTFLIHVEGWLGNKLRGLYFRANLKSLGEGCIFEPGVVIMRPDMVSIGDYVKLDRNVVVSGNVVIGRRVHIAQNCMIQGDGGVTIGDYTGIAAGTMIYSATDTVHDGKRLGPMIPPEYRNPVIRSPVHIGKDVLIGAGSIILPGVTVGTGAVVGAGGLVINDVPAWKIAVGRPAKPIKHRRKIMLHEF